MASQYEPSEGSYILNRLFYFPTDGGPALAVAVSAANASSILSIYSILVNTAVGQVWAIIVIIGVYATLRQPSESRSYNEVVASVGVLNAKRPLEVGALTFNYLWKLKRKSTWTMLLWLFVSIFALIASAGIPALIGRSMVLGHGAPVNPNSIFAPGGNVSEDRRMAFLLHTLQVPSALRAAGSVQLKTDSAYADKIKIDAPVRQNNRDDVGEGEYTSQYGYRYNITAQDFGLQRYSNLTLHVEGLCTTEYSWQRNSSEGTYCLWGICGQETYVDTSTLKSPMPVALFKAAFDITADETMHSNVSFAIVISSVGCSSYTQGEDPFYLTGPNPAYTVGPNSSVPVYQVKTGRPVLSCWQSETWTYKNRRSSVTGLSGNGSVEGIVEGFPEALTSILTSYLYTPKIVTLGTHLGQSALFSATRSALGPVFDAEGASVHADLTHLVTASYISTKNTLTDLTLFRNDSTTDMNILNLVQEQDRRDVAIFVLYSKEISALSLAVLISVPIVVAVMFLIAYILTTHPWFPWYMVQGYQATVLYSLLDERLSGAEGIPSNAGSQEQGIGRNTWTRKTIAWSEGPRASGRQASIVRGANGQSTLIVMECAENSTTNQMPAQRNEITLHEKA